MKPIEEYSLVPPGKKGGRARIRRPGQAQPLEVEGALLEAQFELEDGRRLVWLSDDSPYDEGLHIYLLGHEDTVEDSIHAGADFAAGIVKFREVGEWSVDFEFFLNAVVYHLGVEQAPRFRLRLPTGWRYEHPLIQHRLEKLATSCCTASQLGPRGKPSCAKRRGASMAAAIPLAHPCASA